MKFSVATQNKTPPREKVSRTISHLARAAAACQRMLMAAEDGSAEHTVLKNQVSTLGEANKMATALFKAAQKARSRTKCQSSLNPNPGDPGTSPL
jgi:hypothetical protein